VSEAQVEGVLSTEELAERVRSLSLHDAFSLFAEQEITIGDERWVRAEDTGRWVRVK
jgi:hypothetical protein